MLLLFAGAKTTATANSGILVAGSSVVAGVGTTRSTGTGTLVAGSSVVIGAGTTRSTGTGILTATSSAVSGSGGIVVTGTGVLVAGGAAVTPATYRGSSVTESNSGTIVWPSGTVAGDTAIIELFGNGTLTPTGSGWTPDVNVAPINDQGSNWSAFHKTLTAGDITTPPSYSGCDYGGVVVYVAQGASSTNFNGNTAAVAGPSNTLTGFVKTANSSLIASLVIDRTTVTPTIISPAGWTDRTPYTTTYFSAGKADLPAASYINNSNITWSGLQSDSMSGAGVWEFVGGAGGAAGSIISGSGTTRSTGTGILTVGSSALSGTATVITIGAGTGILAATPSTITGSGTVAYITSGALVALSSAVTGSGVTASTGFGVLAADRSALAGFSGAVVITSLGNLVVGAATVTATGTTRSVGVGSLTDQAASVTGSGVTVTIGTGALVSNTAAVTGTGRPITVTQGVGTLVTSEASLNSIGFVFARLFAAGDLVVGEVTLQGSGRVFTGLPAVGDLVAGAATISGSGVGGLADIPRTIVGAGEHRMIVSSSETRVITGYPPGTRIISSNSPG